VTFDTGRSGVLIADSLLVLMCFILMCAIAAAHQRHRAGTPIMSRPRYTLSVVRPSCTCVWTHILSCWDAEVVEPVLETSGGGSAFSDEEAREPASITSSDQLTASLGTQSVPDRGVLEPAVRSSDNATASLETPPIAEGHTCAATPSDPDKDDPQRTYIPSLEELRAALAKHPPTPSDTEDDIVEQPSVPLSKNKMRKLKRAALRNLPPVPTTTFTDIPKYYQGRAYHEYKRSIGFA
jgi:hypothetical protein